MSKLSLLLLLLPTFRLQFFLFLVFGNPHFEARNCLGFPRAFCALFFVPLLCIESFWCVNILFVFQGREKEIFLVQLISCFYLHTFLWLHT